jgi:Na+-transporting NADH:ubiquinone oxidoreductase subunit NqrB
MWSIIIAVIAISIAIYAMVSISSSHMEKGRKMIWFALVVLIPLIGPAIYYLRKPYHH